MGWLTTEELLDGTTAGKLMTHAPTTYKIPTVNDCPPRFPRASVQEERNVADSIHR